MLLSDVCLRGAGHIVSPRAQLVSVLLFCSKMLSCGRSNLRDGIYRRDFGDVQGPCWMEL